MTKNINYVSHKKSKVKSNGKPQLPLADALVEGEIAINYAEDVETLSIKNESGTVVTFSSDNYYTEQKLGSGFTGANSAKTVTEVIVENEKVISSSLNDLNARKMDASAYTPTDLSNYYTKSETSGKTEISTALGLKADATDIPSVTGYADSVMYNSSTHYVEFYHGTTAGTMVFSYDASPFLIDGMVESVVITSVTSGQSEVQVLEITWNSAAGSQVTDIPLTDIFNPNLYYTKDEIDEAELVISSSLNDLNDRKLDASAYTPTDLTNYYTKSETSGKTEISSALGAKLNSATYTAYTAATETTLNGKQNTLTAGTGVNITNDVISVDVEQVFDDTVSASTKPVASKALYSAITDNELVWTNAYTSLSGAVSSHTNNTNAHITSADRTKLNSITGVLGTMAYENSSSYSSATQVNSALGGKADTSHNQASSTITAMTSYTSGGTVSPIQTSDTLNQAIGKLESGLGGFRLLQITQQAYDDLQSKDPNTLYIIVD